MSDGVQGKSPFAWIVTSEFRALGRAMGATAVGMTMLASTGCALAEGVLKQPVVSKCTSLGLKDCSDFTDGVVDYATGDKALPEGNRVERAAPSPHRGSHGPRSQRLMRAQRSSRREWGELLGTPAEGGHGGVAGSNCRNVPTIWAEWRIELSERSDNLGRMPPFRALPSRFGQVKPVPSTHNSGHTAPSGSRAPSVLATAPPCGPPATPFLRDPLVCLLHWNLGFVA